jgi:hypothetical protein
VDWLVKAKVSKYYAVSTFRSEMMSWDSEELYSVAGGKGQSNGFYLSQASTHFIHDLKKWTVSHRGINCVLWALKRFDFICPTLIHTPLF